MPAPAPIVHPLAPDEDPAVRVAQLVSAQGAGAEPGLHVLVRVADTGNMGYARVIAPPHTGAKLQRWVQHARRGSSPGGWSHDHHPKAEKALGQWKRRNEQALDRLVIDHCKQAWRLDHEAPYIAEFAVLDLASSGIEPPPTGE